jgi:hypothetical protein
LMQMQIPQTLKLTTLRLLNNSLYKLCVLIKKKKKRKNVLIYLKLIIIITLRFLTASILIMIDMKYKGGSCFFFNCKKILLFLL